MSAVKTALSFDTSPWDPTHRLVTSWLLTPWHLFLCRAVLTAYTFTAIFVMIGWYAAHARLDDLRRSFSFFTVLVYWGQALYLLAAALHTFTYARSGRPLLARLPRPLQALHGLYYSSDPLPWIHLLWLRRWLTETRLGMSGRFAPYPRAAVVDQEKDVVDPDTLGFQNASGPIEPN